MKYCSTRSLNDQLTSAQAITQGLSPEGGLYVPESFPQITMEDIKSYASLSYAQTAQEIMKLYLTDFTDDEIQFSTQNAYSDNFDSENTIELVKLGDSAHILELWHGPTCAFKDMALQILPYLLTISAKKTIQGKKVVILVATSGDTGKAALEGFKDVEGTAIIVFYPRDGVSNMQKRQMITQEGDNVFVCAVNGNFDDCQNGVKAIFVDNEIIERLDEMNVVLSSANSINWGRLLPQIVYYVRSYTKLMADNTIQPGEEINVVVPTGNFGNILAAYYAKKMGLPIKKFICASNKNNILTDFIETGIYDRNRPFHTTISPSMDILISSNLERLLFDLADRDTTLINDWFLKLKTEGRYEVSDKVKTALKKEFYAGYCDDVKTKETIKAVFEKENYLMDTHTAVAYKVYEDYRTQTGDTTKTVIASTANPYKFPASVYEALTGKAIEDEYEVSELLERLTQSKIPQPLAETKGKPARFELSVDKEQMPGIVNGFLKEKESF
jgi:threonine synthase